MIDRIDLYFAVAVVIFSIIFSSFFFSLKFHERSIEKMNEQFSIQEYNHGVLLNVLLARDSVPVVRFDENLNEVKNCE